MPAALKEVKTQNTMTKKYLLLAFFAFALLCINIFGCRAASPLKVDISGRGSMPAVFVPGFGCSGEVWRETLPLFEDRYRCYVLTMPGVAGVSPAEGPAIRNWEKYIADYFEDAGLKNVLVIGHSMGGGLAMLLAADYPDLVSKIVVVDALPCLAAAGDPSFKPKSGDDCGPMVKMMAAMTDSQYYQAQLRMLPQLVADQSKVPQIAKWGAASDRQTLASIYCDFLNTDLREKIAAVKCPALVMLEPSFAAMKPAIEAQFAKMKTARLEYATKGLHFIMYDDRQWYDSQLKAFINP